MGDSGKESEDDKSRQDDPDPKICPHKTLNIRSSGNSSDIKDLLTSCDHLSDASLRELLTSYPSKKDPRTSTDDLNADPIIQTSYIKDYETQSDCSVEELSSSGSETTVCEPFAPCDDFLVELLKPTVSASKDLPSIDLHVCCHESDRRNEPISEESGKLPHFVCKEQHPQPDTFTKEATDDELLKQHQTSPGSCKKSQTETCVIMAVKHSPVVSFVSRKNCISERHGKKQMGESVSSCHGPSLKSKTDLISGQIPPLSELLLMKSGDVELNPGPREAAGWSLELERELLSLVKDVSPVHYYDLCNALDVSHAQSQVILTKNLLDVSKSLFEVICSWGIKQRDGTNYKRLLAEKLRSVHLDALGTKLEEGGYSTQDTPTQYPILDTSQPFMTEAQVLQCGEDLKTFYREQMCKIKPDPLDFNIIVEFEQIYTNLTLLRNKMGTIGTKTPLDYTDLLTTKVNGVLPKRLLVEGEGGVGKTTFCSKIAWDWVNGSPEFQRFSWGLVIPLRNVVKGQTIGDIMKTYLSDNNAINPKQIENYMLSQPTKVLIVLDGLDEYDGDLSAKESSDISQILRLEKFKQCIVLVTTRPWRADQIKSNEGLSRSYAFIAVEGFSAENVSTYISKYFVNDEKAGSELSQFIEVNGVIKENMAPFPIYVAMLCILWKNCDSEKRETIRRLKTFSQLFEQMIMFLGDHYVSKVVKVLHEAHLDKEKEIIKLCLQSIGSIAFTGLLNKKLVFNEVDFSSCKEAMETCCRIGVLSRENRNVSRWKRTFTASQPITTCVFFPHKLFQEYIASVYLASLYDTDRKKYKRSRRKVLRKNPQEFRYLLYFTAALGEEVGLDIVNKIQQNDFPNVQQRRRNNDLIVDVSFEANNKDTAKAVGQWIFADRRMLTIDKNMPAHTISGYLFIMEQHGMETLVFRSRSCGPTVSRDLADILFASNSLSRLEFYRTSLDDDFYKLMHTQVYTMAGDKSSIKELVVDHQFLNGLQKFNNGDINVTIGDLFPSLTQLTFATCHTVSPGDIERLAHSSLAVLSIEHGEEVEGRTLVPLIGEPASLGQLFSNSFPQLTCLTFRGLLMGNIRSEAILHYLKNHLHLKSVRYVYQGHVCRNCHYFQ
ncbi:uncharacterized protein LOC105437098 [Strongylocentrotus purpuratus]|uniref:NACHT domain-containing protein n=1 Tax=Strongylocentrotus purpuratus TaxID=7668 RepID=A0A7M7P3S6_STRPU|nr:uncharacterized protein LOC105437098 [Strongylocentrotus purpuratus]